MKMTVKNDIENNDNDNSDNDRTAAITILVMFK